MKWFRVEMVSNAGTANHEFWVEAKDLADAIRLASWIIDGHLKNLEELTIAERIRA